MKQLLNGNWYLKPFSRTDKFGALGDWYLQSTFSTLRPECIITQVPSNWNVHESLERFEGKCWYFLEFSLKSELPAKCAINLVFKGANYITNVYLNDHFIGKNEGGFLPFSIPINRRWLKKSGTNFIAVSVDNTRTRNGIPSFNTDWYNWGGIHRDVYIEVLPETRVQNIRITPKLPSKSKAILEIQYDVINIDRYFISQINSGATPTIFYRINYLGNLSSRSSVKGHKVLINETEITVDEIKSFAVHESKIEPPAPIEQSEIQPKEENASSETEEFDQSFDFDDLSDFDEFDDEIDEMDNFDDEGATPLCRVKHTVEISNPSLWSPENPDLYEFEISIIGTDEEFVQRFGIREIKTHGVGLYLNKKLLKIRGVSLHEEQVPYGRHYPEEMRRNEVLRIKEYGFNTIRSAHYSHDEILMKIADEEGILIFEEIPLYWDCTFGDRYTQLLGLKMLKTLVQRDYNHPSVIVWSVGNEIPVENPQCANAIQNFLTFTKSLDSSRLVTYVTARFWNDTLRRKTDLICQNQYTGWYFGRSSHLNMLLESISPTAPNQPWIMSEFGAGADFDNGDRALGHKFSMEYQEYILKKSIETFNSKPWIAGWIIWIYRDFKSPLRVNKYQRGFNRKGIVSDSNKEKLFARNAAKIINVVGRNIRTHPIIGRFAFVLLKKLADIGFGIGQKVADKATKAQIDKYYTTTPK